MRFATPYIAVLATVLCGCSHIYPVAMYAHTSDPTEGRPVNHDCDPTSDFAGGGIGYEHKNTRVYATVGQKLVRQCAMPGRPHVDARSTGASLLVIQEFRRER